MAERRANRLYFLTHCQSWRENRRCLPGYEGLRLPEQGSYIHDPSDVDGAHLWNDLFFVWLVARNNRRRAVFSTCRGGYRERGHPDRDRQRVLSAPPLVAGSGAGKCASGTRGSDGASAGRWKNRMISETFDVPQDSACQ